MFRFPVTNTAIARNVIGMIRMNLVMKIGFVEASVMNDSATPKPIFMTRFIRNVIGMIRMNLVMKIGFGVALSFMTLASTAQADEFKLSNNQRISCSRGLSAGKLN